MSLASEAMPQLRGTAIEKAPTGVAGLDDITGGGLPRGRTTLVCGGAGCGKTLFAMEFLVRGAAQFDEPGVVITFEESKDELIANVRSLGFDLGELVERKRVAMDHVRVSRGDFEETGEYDLEGLFVRLAFAIDSVGAKRVVLDTIESLFAGFGNEAVLRSELVRLFRWLKDRGLTTVITGERGDGMLTRHGLEEYVSDCVILLDHRVSEQVSTRRLRVVKYRGTSHGTNEYPFLIDAHGFSVLPVTSLRLDHQASTERISTGVAGLDAMLGGGFFHGSSVLISGTAGTGKTSLGAHFADACCRRGERVLVLAFEESGPQIERNAKSIGIDLSAWRERGLLRIEATRPTRLGLEAHLLRMYALIQQFEPVALVMDPITNLEDGGASEQANELLVRLIDFLKARGITGLFTSLTSGGAALEQTTTGVSSLMDVWLLVRDVEDHGERNRLIHVLKARGMKHSNQVREFLITDSGVTLLDVSIGPDGVLTGSARQSHEAREREERTRREQEAAKLRRALERKRRAIEFQIENLRAELQSEQDDAQALLEQWTARERRLERDRVALAEGRQSDLAVSGGNGDPGKVRAHCAQERVS